jgi:hypothetical protein
MAPDSPATVHIRCGSDIHDALRATGFVGRFLEFSDPYCQGPVAALPLEPFVQSRSAFITRAYHLDEANTLARLNGQYVALSDLAA